MGIPYLGKTVLKLKWDPDAAGTWSGNKLCSDLKNPVESPGTGEFPAQMASNSENDSIWWRHHELIDHAWDTECNELTYVEKTKQKNHPIISTDGWCNHESSKRCLV